MKNTDYVLQYDEYQKKVKELLNKFEKKEISFEEMSAQILKEIQFLETAYVNLIEDSED